MTLHKPDPTLFSPPSDAVPGRAPIVVVGAGLSGLVAAYLLERAGRDVILIEARKRIGGRVLGWSTGLAAHRFDLGPAWVWPQANPRLAAWLSGLGLTLFEQYEQGAGLVELPSQAVRRHSTGFAQQPPSMRVVGGMACLIDALHAGLGRTNLLLDTRVRALKAGPAGPGGTVGIEFERGAQVETLQASSVILALPPRLLASALRWSPSLPSEVLERWAATPTWMAGHAKLLAVYQTPFWRAAGLSGSAVSQAGPLAEIHDASDAEGQQAALFGFVGVPAMQRRRIGQPALIEAALAQLARLFGPAALQPLAVHVQDWADEVETATHPDMQPATAHPAPIATALPAPWHARVHLAGSEFAPDFPGYLEGAVLAAERAVQAQQLGRPLLPSG